LAFLAGAFLALAFAFFAGFFLVAMVRWVL
jgi:hypothetical protein